MSGFSEPIQLSTFFDYDSLDPTYRTVVQEHTEEIRRRLRRSAQDVCEIGRRLADVRKRLRHGQFLVWLEAEFGWSQRTAYNFINVNKAFGDKFATVAKIDIATSVLYQLAAPSVPEDLRSQVLKSAASGEKITKKALKLAIQEYKQPRKHEPQISAEPLSPDKPEIITLIPQSTVAAQPSVEEPPTASTVTITPGWYHLDGQHLLFCGDTASSSFAKAAPPAKLAVAVTTQDWAHDWLVDQASSLVVVGEADLTINKLEQLLHLFSSPGETVIFPWLPLPEMLAIAHRLRRKVYAGDAEPGRCELAITSCGLKPGRISGGPPASFSDEGLQG